MRKIGLLVSEKNSGIGEVIPRLIQGLTADFDGELFIHRSSMGSNTKNQYEAVGTHVVNDLSMVDLIISVGPLSKDHVFNHKTYVAIPLKTGMEAGDWVKLIKESKSVYVDYQQLLITEGLEKETFLYRLGMEYMVEVLHEFGRKYELLDVLNQLKELKNIEKYDSLKEVKDAIEKIGEKCNHFGLSEEFTPWTFGFFGEGPIIEGAQEIFNLLPYKQVSAYILKSNYENFIADNNNFYKVHFKEDDFFSKGSEVFDREDFHNDPYLYLSEFEDFVRYIKGFVYSVDGDVNYPPFITTKFLRNEAFIRRDINLKVIADLHSPQNQIIEQFNHSPKLDSFTYHPKLDKMESGLSREGIYLSKKNNQGLFFQEEYLKISFNSIGKLINKIHPGYLQSK